MLELLAALLHLTGGTEHRTLATGDASTGAASMPGQLMTAGRIVRNRLSCSDEPGAAGRRPDPVSGEARAPGNRGDRTGQPARTDAGQRGNAAAAVLERSGPVVRLGRALPARWLYQIVLGEASRPEDLTSYLDRDTLIALWTELHLPRGVRRAWEEMHPQLRAGRRDAHQ